MTATPLPATSAPGVILLRSDRFVARRVPLAPGSPVAEQVELALENLSPFPLDQLYHGYLPSAAGDEALVYAAYRKQFAAAETGGWTAATAVLPAFVMELEAPPAAPVIRLSRAAESVTALAWDGKHPLPAAVLTRPAADAAALVAELRERTGWDQAPVEEFSGPAVMPPGLSDRDALAAADVREKEFLAERQRTGRRDRVLWRIFAGSVVGLAAVLVLELGLLGAGLGVRRLRAGVQLRAPGVEKIATAQALSVRVEELAKRRLMPFEMLAVLNRVRPPALLFVRVATTGQLALEVDVQTPNAAEAANYEAALRAAPELASVETRDLRSRDGVTSFTLVATFKPEALAPGGAR